MGNPGSCKQTWWFYIAVKDVHCNTATNKNKVSTSPQKVLLQRRYMHVAYIPFIRSMFTITAKNLSSCKKSIAQQH